jgi:hypothetical protein
MINIIFINKLTKLTINNYNYTKSINKIASLNKLFLIFHFNRLSRTQIRNCMTYNIKNKTF